MIINPDLSLNEIKESLRAALKEASEDSRHGLRFFSVATVNAETTRLKAEWLFCGIFCPNGLYDFTLISEAQKLPRYKTTLPFPFCFGT